MHPDKIKNILNLSSVERYGYLIRKVADFEEVWLIKDINGYVRLGDKNENIQIPVFPEEDFAKLFITGDWENCTIEKINVDNFIKWLGDLGNANVKIAGFPSTELNSVVVTADEIKNHLFSEMQQYD